MVEKELYQALEDKKLFEINGRGQTYTPNSSPLWMLNHDVPTLVKYLKMQLQEKSMTTKVGEFLVLKDIVVVSHDFLVDHIGKNIMRNPQTQI